MSLEYVKNSIKSYFLDEDALNYIEEKIPLSKAFIIVWFLIFIFGTLGGFINVITQFGSIPSYALNSIILIELVLLILIPLILILIFGIIHISLKIFGAKSNFSNTLEFP